MIPEKLMHHYEPSLDKSRGSVTQLNSALSKLLRSQQRFSALNRVTPITANSTSEMGMLWASPFLCKTQWYSIALSPLTRILALERCYIIWADNRLPLLHDDGHEAP